MFLDNMPTALAVTTIATLAAQPYVEEVHPVVMVSERSMPQLVPKEYYAVELDGGNNNAFVNARIQQTEIVEPSAIAIYHQLRQEFEISHTEMGNWLGVKRRTLYNWMKEPEKAKKFGLQIEERLVSLSALKEEMEPEHRPILFKIAFSPIYGDPNLGDAILTGVDSKTLIEWYEKLFSQFESYRSMHSSKEQLV